jgi:hypothetical protein
MRILIEMQLTNDGGKLWKIEISILNKRWSHMLGIT